jgi:hypothetical protein
MIAAGDPVTIDAAKTKWSEAVRTCVEQGNRPTRAIAKEDERLIENCTRKRHLRDFVAPPRSIPGVYKIRHFLDPLLPAGFAAFWHFRMGHPTP